MRKINLESTELHEVIAVVNRSILAAIAEHKDTSFEFMALKSARDKLEKVENA